MIYPKNAEKLLLKLSDYLLKINYIFLILFLGNIYSQENSSNIKISFNPTDNEYFMMEQNNFGKEIVSQEIEYQWKLNTEKTDLKITLSNAYNNDIDFGESFVKHEIYNSTFLKAGKYYRDFSLYLNDDLSSGSMLISKNAKPIPKIGILYSMNSKKNNNISFDWGIAHGILEKNELFLEAPFLHEKFMYLNIEKKKYKVSIGLVHEAVWNGKTEYWGDFPDTFKDFFKVIISADGPPDGGAHENALGSHLAIWDFYYERYNDNKSLKLYYQHFFEDTSSLRFANKIDGLWGLELENYITDTNLLFEYIDTTNMCIDSPYQCDYYYWNFQYGPWKYKDNILGNPFINSNNFSEREYLKIFNFGIETKFKSSTFKVKAARKINMNDEIKYKATLEKKIKQTNFNTFIVGNQSNYSFGFGISFYIED
jgi:hypothetical protein